MSDRDQRQKRKNIVVALALLGLVAAIFYLTILKLSGNIA